VNDVKGQGEGGDKGKKVRRRLIGGPRGKGPGNKNEKKIFAIKNRGEKGGGKREKKGGEWDADPGWKKEG